jgi:transposase
MASAQPKDAKLDALRRQGALHPSPERVVDPQFREGEFWDRRDLVQVKYELLRRVQVEHAPVSDACQSFGVSRPVFYKSQQALRQQGLAGLVPKKRGPRGAHKLTEDVLQLVDSALAEDPSLGTEDLVRMLRHRRRLRVHPRTLQRALVRRGKAPRRTRPDRPGRRARK